MIKHITQRLRNSKTLIRKFLKILARKLRNTLKFLLFKEDKPKHRVMKNLNPGLIVLIPFLCLLLGFSGLVVWVKTTFLGFLAYYVIVAVTTLEILHCLYDR